MSRFSENNPKDIEWAREFIDQIEEHVADRTCKGLLPAFYERLRAKLNDVRFEQWLADE